MELWNTMIHSVGTPPWFGFRNLERGPRLRSRGNLSHRLFLIQGNTWCFRLNHNLFSAADDKSELYEDVGRCDTRYNNPF